MALSLGTLFVKLSADPSQLTKGMNDAADKVAKFGNKMNEVAGKLGALGVSMTALGAGALRLAGQFDSQVKAATDGLGNAFAHISVEIGRALLPVVQALTAAFSSFAAYLKGLSPETKEFAAQIAAVAAISLTLVAGVAKVAAAFTSLAPAITGALSPIMPVLLPVIGVIAALIAIVPLLWQAWKSNFGNIQGFTGAVVDFVVDSWKRFRDYFSGTTTFIGNAWNKVSSFLWETWATVMKKIARMASSVAKVFGVDWTNELSAFEETIDDMASRGFQGLVDDATDSIGKVAFQWKEGISDIGKNIKEVLGGAFKSVELGGLTAIQKPGTAGGAGGKAPREVMRMDPIEVVGKVTDQVSTDFQNGMRAVGQKMVNNLGELGGLIQSAVEGLGTGGPIGALIAVAADLLTKTDSFRKLVEKLGKVIEKIVEINDMLFGWVFDLLGYVAEGISYALDWVTDLLTGPVGKPLDTSNFKEIDFLSSSILSVMKNFYGISLSASDLTEQMTQDTAAFFTDLFRTNRGEFERIIAASFPEGSLLKDEFVTIISRMAQRAEAEAAVAAIVGDTAKEFERLNASMTNVPAGFRVALARFNATSPSRVGAIDVPGLGGRQPIEVNVYIDGKKVAKSVQLRNARDWYVKTGGTMPYVPGWVGDL